MALVVLTHSARLAGRGDRSAAPAGVGGTRSRRVGRLLYEGKLDESGQPRTDWHRDLAGRAT